MFTIQESGKWLVAKGDSEMETRPVSEERAQVFYPRYPVSMVSSWPTQSSGLTPAPISLTALSFASVWNGNEPGQRGREGRVHVLANASGFQLRYSFLRSSVNTIPTRATSVGLGETDSGQKLSYSSFPKIVSSRRPPVSKNCGLQQSIIPSASSLVSPRLTISSSSRFLTWSPDHGRSEVSKMSVG